MIIESLSLLSVRLFYVAADFPMIGNQIRQKHCLDGLLFWILHGLLVREIIFHLIFTSTNLIHNINEKRDDRHLLLIFEREGLH